MNHQKCIEIDKIADKAAALQFLDGLRLSLERRLPSPAKLRAEVREVMYSARDNATRPHMRRPEEAFLNHFVIPQLFNELQTQLGLEPKRAQTALLSENYRHMQTLSSGSPVRKDRHPFDKSLARNPEDVMSQWRNGKTSALRQSCPDFALRDPCPHSVVFEGKYFEIGSVARAETELVSSIYQAFFYRALPKVERSHSHAAWNYQFSCLLACDASPEASFKRAWDSLPARVQKGFWEGANVYVMILRAEV